MFTWTPANGISINTNLHKPNDTRLVRKAEAHTLPLQTKIKENETICKKQTENTIILRLSAMKWQASEIKVKRRHRQTPTAHSILK